MGLVNIDPELKDCIQVKLGNIGKNEKIEITLKYIEILILHSNKYFELILPFTLTPRYK